jgi:hypothetical protein
MVAAFSKLQRFPRNRLIEEELARGRVSELDLLMRFGDPTTQSDARDDPVFFWDLEWSCGLVVALQFKQVTEVLGLRLDEPDVDHALRHLGFPIDDLWLLEVAAPDRFRALAGPVDRTWQVWRESGEPPEPVAVALTQRDATCWCAEIADRERGDRFRVRRAER